MKEFYTGIKGNNLSDVRMDEIQRVFNELWQRDEVYKNLLRQDGSVLLKNVAIENVHWLGSPLHEFHVVFTTDVAIANNTETLVTFEESWGVTSVFDFFNNDKSKILFSPGLVNFHMDGFVKWQSNATGYRYTRAYFYKEDGTLIGNQTLHGAAAANGIDTATPISYTDSMPIGFTDAAYVQIKVTQTSGGNLDLQSVRFSVGVA